MPWSTIAESDVLDEFASPGEQAALQRVAGASDKLPNILTRTVNQVRGYCLAGGNRVGPDGTIPDQLRSETIAIARWKWVMAFPGLKTLQTKERKDENDEAIKTLKDVAKGSDRGGIKVELPAEGTAEDVSTPDNAVQVASATTRTFTTGNNPIDQTSGRLDGLI